jgi:hypothetical protein
LSGACAAIASLFASKRLRLISIALLMASVVLAATFYPAFKRDREIYIQRVKGHALSPQATTLKD